LRILYQDGRDENSSYILSALRIKYPSARIHTNVGDLLADRGAAIVVAVGPAALTEILGVQSSLPADSVVLSLFTSRQVFEKIAGSNPLSKSSKKSISAVFAETSAASQLQLTASLFRRRVSVGLLLSERNSHFADSLKRAAQQFDLELTAEVIEGDANVLRALASLNHAKAFLAVPDQVVFSSENARAILESCYRRGQPVIGFNPSMVRAGALGSTYASIEDVLEQVDDTILSIQAGRTAEAGYPLYWRTVFNDQIARSLNIVIPEESRMLSGKAGFR
jgi:ABC-type uncharacterized transport system substrate-binding protein